MENWFVKWRPYQGNIETTPVKIDEYLPMGKNIILGAQHAFAMFGATILAPLLMGFDPKLNHDDNRLWHDFVLFNNRRPCT